MTKKRVKSKTSFFWTDSQQASERLTSCFVLYKGEPCFISEVDTQTEPPRVRLTSLPSSSLDLDSTRKRLDSKYFDNFRVLPVQGWINSERDKKAIFLKRRARSTRTHGLCNGNIIISDPCNHGKGFTLYERPTNFLMREKGWLDAQNKNFPSLEDTLRNISCGCTVAVSSSFAISRCDKGLRWLWREEEKVGLFTDVSSILLFKGLFYLREEISENDTFKSINSIVEF